ncbi:MAG: ABC transporter permease [Meiothermus sp.]|nr:ABC transporter permease [Meiothermus sp.]
MTTYALQRLLIAIPTLLVVTVLVFTMLQFTPGDPLDAYLPPDQIVSEAQRERLRQDLGLDQPPVVQYFFWLGRALQGNLGLRAKNYEPVNQAIGNRVGPTLLLMAAGMGLGISLGIGLGILAAVRQYSITDSALTVLAFLGISTPAFIAGLLGLYFFSLKLGWFPSGGFENPSATNPFLDRLHHLVLPAVVLSLFYIAVIMRYTRAAMLEAISQDYVRTARSKGLEERVVINKHTLRNALLPVVTIIGANLANLLGGAIFIESIYSWPGMGSLYLDAVESRDYPLIMGLTLILASAVLIANLLTDMLYAVIDPRIRYN